MSGRSRATKSRFAQDAARLVAKLWGECADQAAASVTPRPITKLEACALVDDSRCTVCLAKYRAPEYDCDCTKNPNAGDVVELDA